MSKVEEIKTLWTEGKIACLCRVVMDRRGEVSISSAHCELHGPKPGTQEFADMEQAEAERRLANGS